MLLTNFLLARFESSAEIKMKLLPNSFPVTASVQVKLPSLQGPALQRIRSLNICKAQGLGDDGYDEMVTTKSELCGVLQLHLKRSLISTKETDTKHDIENPFERRRMKRVSTLVHGDGAMIPCNHAQTCTPEAQSSKWKNT